jgi:hypothetical protein
MKSRKSASTATMPGRAGQKVVGDVDQRAARQPFGDDDRQKRQHQRIDESCRGAERAGALL